MNQGEIILIAVIFYLFVCLPFPLFRNKLNMWLNILIALLNNL